MTETPPLDFQSLRLRGLDWLQRYAGERWTDYNVHDPGVTLLEALVYGLTDLAYRVDFATADLLTPRQDRLDLAALGLLPPEQALPSRPATPEDWRAVILDADRSIDNAWVDPVVDDPGCLRISLFAGRVRGGDARAGLLRWVRAAFDANRNAGEDAATIGFVREIPCTLAVEAEVERDREPSEIAAEMFDRCAALLTAGVRAVPFEELRRAGAPLDAVFLGPLGQCGLFDREQLRDTASSSVPTDLLDDAAQAPERFFRAVGQIADVRFVQGLRLVLPQDGLPAPGEAAVLVLQQPVAGAGGAAGIALTSRGRPLPVDPVRMGYHIDRFALERSDRMRPHQSPDAIIERPVGHYLGVDRYTLVQSHLPRLYHVTPQGLGPSATEAERARARQLRGFLLQFEQALADFLAHLDALPAVFAARDGEAGYRHSAAPGAGLPAEDRDLYPSAPGMAGGMAGVGDAYTDALDRRGRVLDYLLALYGEQFSQNSLRSFDLYRVGVEKDEAVIANRERFLAQVAGMTRDRGGGADLRLAEDAGGLARRLALLLDLRPAGEPPRLTAGLGDRSADYYWDPPAGRQRHARIARTRLPEPLEGQALLSDDGAGVDLDGLIAALRPHDLLTPGPIHPSLVAFGCQLDRFAIRRSADGWWLLLDDGEPDDVLVVGLFRDRATARRVANLVRRFSVQVCRNAEGVFVVEGVLLRPRSDAAFAAPLRQRQQARQMRLTAVFSGWTARTAQPGFRSLARETLRLNSPAHLMVEDCWLETFEALAAFEQAHADWRAALAALADAPGEAARAEAADRAALRLVGLLEPASPAGP
ncbi:MAG: hypothetical protein KDC18_05865 [Alphaproteobacteria bacterium]|nr:hypothetical protein [Alphaproteobacteria bacterium]MCB9931651.1 hypothetical protein [Alphaproteobacteria bacterium]